MLCNHLLKLISLAILISTAWAQSNPCHSVATNCQTCISLPQCGWCSDEIYLSSRCDIVQNLRQNSCQRISNPQSTSSATTAPQFSDTQQVSPTRFEVSLRPGMPANINIQVRPARDYPVDLYILMDMSRSMLPHLERLTNIATQLAGTIRNLSSQSSFGFGTFVEKPIIPFSFGAINRQDYPCSTSDKTRGISCDPVYLYRNGRPLTTDINQFQQGIDQQNISSNRDAPEGGLEALLQVSVCPQHVGWRQDARHIVVYCTDDFFHYAGDSKLAGIVTPNDGKCHMNADNKYEAALLMDYPSISQLRDSLIENKILPVFAVLNRALSEHQALSEQLIGTGAIVGEWENDGSNIISLIEESYRRISSTVLLTNSFVENVLVNYTATCPNNNPVEGLTVCNETRYLETANFNLSLKLTQCPTDGRTSDEMVVRVTGFENVVVKINYICQCECALPQNTEQNSPKCNNGNGNYSCGQCHCLAGWIGERCQCDAANSFLDAPRCQEGNSSVICNNRGSCVCGLCECQTDVRGRIYGSYCECDNFTCPLGNNLLCSGHGTCNCGICQCNGGYTGRTCSCPLSTATCMASNGLECNGRGACECGSCICSSSLEETYTGRTCEVCTTCPGECEKTGECIACKRFNQGSYDAAACNANCNNITMTVIDRIPQNTDTCQHQLINQCRVRFAINITTEGLKLVMIESQQICPEPPPLAPIIGGVVGGVIGLGIIAVIVVKIVFMIQDYREFQKFEKERKGANWVNSESPIYTQATSKFKNPIYSG